MILKKIFKKSTNKVTDTLIIYLIGNTIDVINDKFITKEMSKKQAVNGIEVWWVFLKYKGCYS